MDGLVRIALRTVRQQAIQLLQTHDRPPINRFSPRGLQEYVHQMRTRTCRDFQEVVSTHFPDHIVVTDRIKSSLPTGYCWYFEPMCGEENFLRSLPEYCAVIGIFENRELQHSVIYHYLEDGAFVATRDEGALVNQSRLRVSATRTINQAVIAYEQQDFDSVFLKKIEALQYLSASVRTSGCIALDIARVAQGKLDACVHVGDWHSISSATSLLVTEAGGFTSPTENNDAPFIAGNPQIFKTLMSKLRPEKSDLVLSRSK